MTNFCRYASLVAAVFATASRLSAAPVVLDGSFESPAITGGTIASGGNDWTASGSGVYIASNAIGLGQTPYGTQYLALNPGTSDSQVIPGFVSGVKYTFNANFADLINGSDPALTVTLSGVVSLSQTFTAPVGGLYGAGTIPFSTATLSFIPTASGTVTLTLIDASRTGTIGVDNVFVVPEPSEFVTAFLGLGTVIAILGKHCLQKARALLR